jgi:site-specific DNA recombinase
MSRCVIYSRVSTDAQERDGTSLDTQERACADFAASSGWTVIEQIRDTASGFTLERPGIERLREVVRSKAAEVVLTYAVDRLSRNQNHIGVLFDDANQFGVRLDFVTEKFEDTAVGRFILAARAFVAEIEREKIVERTQRGKTQRAKSGKLPQATGRGMYGYRYDVSSGTREIEGVEAAIVRAVFERFVAGESCHRLSCSLNEAGTAAFNGGPWYPLTIRRMLLNESYTGRSIFQRTKAERFKDPRTGKVRRIISTRDESEWIDVVGATPPIVTPEQFNRAKAIMESPERRNRTQPSFAYPLRGRLRCSRCGSPMVGHSLNRGRYLYYRCRHSYGSEWAERCESRYVRCSRVDSAVKSALGELLANPRRILAEAKRMTGEASTSTGLAKVATALSEVEARQRRLVRLFTEGNLPEDLLEEQRRDLSTRRAHLEAERIRLESASTNRSELTRLADDLPAITKAIRTWVGDTDGERFDLLLRAVDARIQASHTEVRIEGRIPLFESAERLDLVTIERTSA